MAQVVMLVIFVINSVEFKGIHYAAALRDDISCFALLLREYQCSSSFTQLKFGL